VPMIARNPRADTARADTARADTVRRAPIAFVIHFIGIDRQTPPIHPPMAKAARAHSLFGAG